MYTCRWSRSQVLRVSSRIDHVWDDTPSKFPTSTWAIGARLFTKSNISRLPCFKHSTSRPSERSVGLEELPYFFHIVRARVYDLLLLFTHFLSPDYFSRILQSPQQASKNIAYINDVYEFIYGFIYAIIYMRPYIKPCIESYMELYEIINRIIYETIYKPFMEPYINRYGC